MAQLYLLPCANCGHKIEIEPKQAGSEIVCPACQAKITAPTMGGIKKLELSQSSGVMVDPKAGSTSGRHYGIKQWLFAGGLLVLVLAAVSGFAIWFYADSLVTISDMDARVAQANQNIPNLRPAQVWDAWDDLTSAGPMDEWKESPRQGQNKQAGYLKSFAYGFMGIAALGLVSIGLSFLVKQR
ncbi:MAG: hypothetical protein MK108_03350 [Mariniblastus sp.]|nr:hypothetical protein [Mariniblastus sp.]